MGVLLVKRPQRHRLQLVKKSIKTPKYLLELKKITSESKIVYNG